MVHHFKTTQHVLQSNDLLGSTGGGVSFGVDFSSSIWNGLKNQMEQYDYFKVKMIEMIVKPTLSPTGVAALSIVMSHRRAPWTYDWDDTPLFVPSNENYVISDPRCKFWNVNRPIRFRFVPRRYIPIYPSNTSNATSTPANMAGTVPMKGLGWMGTSGLTSTNPLANYAAAPVKMFIPASPDSSNVVQEYDTFTTIHWCGKKPVVN